VDPRMKLEIEVTARLPSAPRGASSSVMVTTTFPEST
jgi:hypothetical protein